MVGGTPGVAEGDGEVETGQVVVEAGLRRSVTTHTPAAGVRLTSYVMCICFSLCFQGGGVSVPNVDDPEAFPALA